MAIRLSLTLSGSRRSSTAVSLRDFYTTNQTVPFLLLCFRRGMATKCVKVLVHKH